MNLPYTKAYLTRFYSRFAAQGDSPCQELLTRYQPIPIDLYGNEDEVMKRLREQLQPRIDAFRESERITEADLKLIVY